MSKDCERYCTVQESLRESLQQMQLIRQGKMERCTWKHVMESLKENMEELRRKIMSKVSFSKLYEIYVPMRDEIEDKLDKAKKLYKQNKTEENKKELEVYKREFEMMNKVINSLYYCMEKK